MNGSDFVLRVRAEADIATFPDPEKHHLIKITGPVVLVILRRLFYMKTTAKQQTASFSASETKH